MAERKEKGAKFYNRKLCQPPRVLVQFILDNWFLFLATIVSGAMLAWPSLSKSSAGRRVTPAEAVTLINREKAVLIDVGEPDEYARGHAAGAKNVPFGSLEASTDLPKNKALPVVLMCANGARAGRAAGILRKLGYERAVPLEGGSAAWRTANLPFERSA